MDQLNDISARVWRARYAQPGESTIEDSWRRVARALAGAEKSRRASWEKQFYAALEDFRFLPGGRILAGAGTAHQVTLLNCFVMGTIADSLDGIFDGLKEGALTMQAGGGVGYDFSTLRPRGDIAHKSGAVASGPVSFMRIWDAMCATILSTGARRGAMMATLRCDHPDIVEFVSAKQDAASLRHFNLSVLASDAFMQAVADGAPWPLVFDGVEHGRIAARGLWDRIMQATYAYAEPGVIFPGRVNRLNNLWYCEKISATNPCGEIPLPPYGACDLGSLNLTRFVRNPFTAQAALDVENLCATAAVAVRMLDNVHQLSRFPLRRQAQTARASRRIGLGITGLADALVMLGMRYGDERSFQAAAQIMQAVCHSAYHASVALASEKGAFPLFDAGQYLRGEFVRALPRDIRQAIRRHGLRNSHLTAIAPAGSISLLAGNVSSGLEPVFEFEYRRRIRAQHGELDEFAVSDYARRLYRSIHGDAALPAAFVTARDIPPAAHLKMQAALQAHVDNAISKTINVPQDYDFAQFSSLYRQAYQLGLKGCTTFRPNPVTGEILVATPPEKSCCAAE